MRTVDARGLSCPQPVIMAKKALDESDEVEVLVSERSSAENVADMARSAGADASIEEKDGYLSVRAVKAGRSAVAQAEASAVTVWIIDSDSVGRGDDELGGLLRKSFLGALAEVETKPVHVILVNSGVKLVAEGSPVLEPLKRLENSGVKISACGTCLDFYALKDKVAVGAVSNMYNFIELLMEADKVINF